MADAVTTVKLVDGVRNVVMHFTNVSDGAGEAAVVKVDVSALSGAPREVTIDKVEFATEGMGVEILWDATVDVRAVLIPASSQGEMNFERDGGLRNSAGAGKTGDILFTTVGDDSGDRYDITIRMRKVY